MRTGGQVGAPRGTGGWVRGPYVGGNYYRGGSFYRGGGYYAPRYYAGGRYYGGGRYWGGNSWNVAPARYYRPYYAFRPHVRLGFGIFVGFPVAYPTWYNSYLPGAYGWYRPGIAYGGMSFDIQPYDADIYVDGEYVGIVRDFGPYTAPLTLPAGLHHIELAAPGYEPLSFDITIVPRQVIPYQGALPR